MWPMLLNLTRDECRLTLRRLELEAYSNMVSVFRAQGALEDNRKKLLEELRAVLHISQDRHSAEARRVSNDELLATIAEQLSGPNTNIGWICEGRRRVPLLPRGVAQTAYAEIADKIAEATAAENKEIQKRLEEKLQSSNDEEMPDADGHTTEATLSSNENMDDVVYPHVAMEDQTLKLWDTELITRKRKVPEGDTRPGDPTPNKNIRNIPPNANQKHLNLSQIYSKFSQPISSKPAGQSKHSYNQVSKVSTTKSQTPRAAHKPRVQKAKNAQTKQKRKSQATEAPPSPSKQQYGSSAIDLLHLSGPPNTFQASYAQAVLASKSKLELEDARAEAYGRGDAPPVSEHPDPAAPVAPAIKPLPGKVSHLVPKSRGETTPDAKQSDFKILQKPAEGVKVPASRPVAVSQTPAPKAASAAPQKVTSAPGKLVTTKVIGSIPKARTSVGAPGAAEKMIVVSKATPDNRNLSNSRLVVTSAGGAAPRATGGDVARLTGSLTPKGIPATDLKVSAKAVVLNSKSGQKMVVVPAKGRAKPGSEAPISMLHFKGIPTAMKLLPVSSQPPAPKSSAVTVLPRPPPAGTLASSPKVIGMETIKTANLADIVPVKGLTPVAAPKITNPILRPSSTKGNVIVVQKGTPIGKALTFAKNGNDMSKIIMGKNVTQLLQASKTDTDAGKPPGNVIVLELNDEQTGRPTTMSEILDSRAAKPAPDAKAAPITADTPVLFDDRLADETRDAGAAAPAKEHAKDPEGAKESSAATDWEIELDTVSRKDKDDDKLNSLHLDLGMSSDSDGEFSGAARRKGRAAARAPRPPPAAGESGESFGAMSLATRTLLSQLQDECSSSDDSSFALRPRAAAADSDDLTKAKEKLSEKVAEAKSQRRRIDVYSTAITPTDINLDSFGYLDESIMAGDDVFEESKPPRDRRDLALHDQLSRLLHDDHPAHRK